MTGIPDVMRVPRPSRLLTLAQLGARLLHNWEPRRGPTGDHGLTFEMCPNDDCVRVREALAAETSHRGLTND